MSIRTKTTPNLKMNLKMLSADSETIPMNDLVVGSTECKIRTIVEILTNDVAKLTHIKLRCLMLTLGTSNQWIERIREHERLGMPIIHSMEIVLMEWTDRCGNNATLKILINSLLHCNLNSNAERLNKHFFSTGLGKDKRKQPLDKKSTSSSAGITDDTAHVSNDRYTDTEKPLLQLDHTIYCLPTRYGSKEPSGCNTESILLTLLETPPMLSRRNIMDLMYRLKTEVTKRKNVHDMLEKDSVHVYTALEIILDDWYIRRSSTATLESLILHLRICNLNSHADALKQRFWDKKIDGQFDVDLIELHKHYQSADLHFGNKCDEGKDNDNGKYNCLVKRRKNKNIWFVLGFVSFSLALLFGSLLLALTNKLVFTTGFNELEYLDDKETSSPVSLTWVPIFNMEENLQSSDVQNIPKSCEGLELDRLIVAESYETFMNELSKISYCDMLSVLIISNNSKAWPIGLDLLQEYNIINITISGSMHIATVFEIIRQSANLVYLHIDSTTDRLQSAPMELRDSYYDLYTLTDCNISLYHLQHLRISSFSYSDEIIEMMMTCVKTKLITLEFDGKVTDNRALQIFHLIQANRKTLQEIRVTGIFQTYFCIIPFDKPMHFLKYLSVKGYNRTSYIDSNVIISYQFCSLFPELNELKLELPVALQHIKILQTCPKLRVLDVSININLPHTTYDLLNITENFPRSKSLAVFIYFKNECPNSTFFQDFRVRIYELKIRSYRLCSNCAINRRTNCYFVQNKNS